MSERHRQTIRIRHHATRHTVRVPRTQVGGADSKISFDWYHISDTTRANKWNEALLLNDNLKRFANVITTPGWNTDNAGKSLTPAEKLTLYIELIERQDGMFRLAISIMYGILDINPESSTFESDIFSKADTINDFELKEYFKDVVKLIIGIRTNYGTIFTYSSGNWLEEKISRLLNDPLPQILLWPERVSNLLIESIARILIDLKNHQNTDDELTKIIADTPRTTQGTMRIATFANNRNTFIQSNALSLTSTGIRDGFYMWHELANSIVPPDTCPGKSCNFNELKSTKEQDFWTNFCGYMRSPLSTDPIEYYFHTKEIKQGQQYNTITFSHLTAYIYKLYSKMEISDVRKVILNPSTFINDKLISSEYRPSDASVASEKENNIAKLLRTLDPSQYTFIFHLVYTIASIETENSVSPVSSSTSI